MFSLRLTQSCGVGGRWQSQREACQTLRQVRKKLPVVVRDGARHCTAMGRPPHDEPLRGVVVLVVEDDEDARYVLTSYLAYFGAHVVEATNGVEALNAMKGVRPDVIVTDMSMPGMDGLELFAEVRKLPGQAERPTPMIACTAFSHLRDAARQAGFQAYFVKPMEPRELVNEIARLVRDVRR